MKVIEEFSEVVDGLRVQGRREVEIPGVISQAEAIAADVKRRAEEAKQARIAELRAKIIDAVALGENVTELRKELRQLVI